MDADKRLDNPPYVATEIPDQTTSTDTDFNLDISNNFGDINQDISSYTAEDLPDGLSINTTTGVISGTPTATGNYTITVTVSDSQRTSAQDTFDLEVEQVNVISGTNDSDTLNGGADDEKIYGEGGDDVLNGGAGNDTLNGGTGNDILNGGTGADTFIIGPGTGLDLIEGFEDGTDAIQLEGIVFGDLDISNVGSSTLIKVAATGENLATLLDIDSTLIGADDFI